MSARGSKQALKERIVALERELAALRRQAREEGARGEECELVFFALGEQALAVPLDRCVEVLPMVEISPLPVELEGILGMIDRRGLATPILDGARRLSTRGGQRTLESQILVLAVGLWEMGLVVDRVLDVRPALLEPLEGPEEVRGKEGLVVGRVRRGGTSALVIEPSGLVSARLGEELLEATADAASTDAEDRT